MSYTPPQKILQRYADVLVNFALGKGKGIKKDDVVMITVSEFAKPLYVELYRAVIRAGGHVISDYRPDAGGAQNIDRDFYVNAQEHQIKFFPAKYLRGLADQIDHTIVVLGETDLKFLQSVDPQKLMARRLARKQFREWLDKKEDQGKWSWTLALYGTAAMAKEAGMNEKEYWDQIIKACFLDMPDPIAKWRSVEAELKQYREKLSQMKIQKVHVKGPDVDLWMTIGDDRVWHSGGGNNIPSFEIFTSPDWRGTNGWIRFNIPLYHYGNKAEGIKLEFKDGLVTKVSAKKNQKFLEHLIATENANKLGEFSMTDKRFSRITRFMAETLYDENIGGPEGNTHVAIGTSFPECYRGGAKKLTKSLRKKLGFNESVIHTDMFSTTPRTVTAYFKKGEPRVIYKDGMYQF
jgi:aminopeptidase